jgi:hypothetical protein
MGVNSSKALNTTINNAVNVSTVKAQQQIISKNYQNTDVNQIIDVVIQGKLTCGTFMLSNDAKINIGSLSQSTAEQTADMTSLVAQALENEAKTAFEQTNKDLTVLQANLGLAVNTAINNSRNEQIISMEQTFETIISQSSSVTQTIKFLVTETAEVVVEGACSFNNISSIEYSSQMVTNAAMDIVTSNETVQAASTEWDTAIAQTNAGLSLGPILGIAIAILVFIIIVALMGKYLPPYIAKKKAEKAASGK